MKSNWRYILVGSACIAAVSCNLPAGSRDVTSLAASDGAGTKLSFVGSFDAQSPAFLALESLAPGNPPSLLISSFGKDVQDAVYATPNFSTAFKNLSSNSAVPTGNKIANGVTWPNGVKMAPAKMFPQPTLVVAGGFLPPGKVGAISLISNPGTQGASELKITKDKFAGPYGWFYHKVEFRDMDGDGDLDIITARALFPLVPIPFVAAGPKGELVWLENPGSSAQGPWTEHV